MKIIGGGGCRVFVDGGKAGAIGDRENHRGEGVGGNGGK